MNSLLWHIVKKDFQHLRGLVAAYWLVLTAQLLLPWWLYSHVRYFPNPGDPGLYFSAELYLSLYWAETFLFWTGAVLVAVIGTRLALADSPNAENAQWRTLPVTRRKMLAAKIIFLVLVAALPYCGAGILTKILQGFPMADWLTGSGMAIILTLFWAVPAVLAAVLFESTTLRILFFLGLTGIGLTIGALAVDAGVNSQDQVIRGCVMVYFILGAGLIGLRYLGLGKMACTVVLLAALLGLWMELPPVLSAISEDIPTDWGYRIPNNFTNYSYIQGHRPPIETAKPPLTIQPAGFTVLENHSGIDGPDQSPHTTHTTTLLGRMPDWASDLPKGEIALLDFYEIKKDLRHLLVSRDTPGPPYEDYISSDIYNFSSEGMPVNLSTLAEAAGLGKYRINSVDSAKPDAWPILGLNETDDLRVKLPDNITGTLHYQTGTFQRVAEMPFKTNAQMTFGTSTMKLLSAEVVHAQKISGEFAPSREYAWVQLRIGHQWTQMAPWPAVNNLPPLRADTARDFCFLWNPQRGECFPIFLAELEMARMQSHYRSFWKIQAFDTMFRLQGDETEVDFRYFENGQSHTMTDNEVDAWLADARLVVVEFTPKHFYQAPATFGPLEHPPMAAKP